MKMSEGRRGSQVEVCLQMQKKLDFYRVLWHYGKDLRGEQLKLKKMEKIPKTLQIFQRFFSSVRNAG